MNHSTIGFVGGGRITRIFLEGWKRAGKSPANVIVSDSNAEVLSTLKSRFPEIQTTSNNTSAASQDLVFLAVHPPLIMEVVAGIRDHLKSSAIMVSLAPKFTIAKLSELLGGFSRLVRVIPNAPSIIGSGFNPHAFGPALSIAEKSRIDDLLAPLGECPEVAEVKLEAYAVLTAMGPTYLWFQMQNLRELAVEFGLDEDEVIPALKGMVNGAARTLLESALSPEEVRDLIPVKPLAEMEPQVTETYRTCLPTIYQKICP